MRALVVTDLDGTLLDAHTYDWRPAQPALTALAEAGVPVVVCTSKTRAEVEPLRARLGLTDPFIIENGGAIFTAAGALGPDIGVPRGAYDVIEIGIAHRRLVALLEEASQAATVAVRGWSAMDVEEVAARCEMSLDAARLALSREYDEPFILEDRSAGAAERLGAEIALRGGRMTRGDRFFHILGPHDKGDAARALIALYDQAWGGLITVVVGDAPNDIPMLALADYPIVVASPLAGTVAACVPGARLTHTPGPAGWNDAILEWLSGRKEGVV